MLFEATENMDLVRRRGRWAQHRSAEIYVQEVGGHRFFASLDPRVRQRIFDLAALAPGLVDMTVRALTSGCPASLLPRLLRSGAAF